MTRRVAIRIVRMIIKEFQAGDDDATLAWRLQEAIKAEQQKPKRRRCTTEASL